MKNLIIIIVLLLGNNAIIKSQDVYQGITISISLKIENEVLDFLMQEKDSIDVLNDVEVLAVGTIMELINANGNITFKTSDGRNARIANDGGMDVFMYVSGIKKEYKVKWKLILHASDLYGKMIDGVPIAYPDYNVKELVNSLDTIRKYEWVEYSYERGKKWPKNISSQVQRSGEEDITPIRITVYSKKGLSSNTIISIEKFREIRTLGELKNNSEEVFTKKHFKVVVRKAELRNVICYMYFYMNSYYVDYSREESEEFHGAKRRIKEGEDFMVRVFYQTRDYHSKIKYKAFKYENGVYRHFFTSKTAKCEGNTIDIRDKMRVSNLGVGDYKMVYTLLDVFGVQLDEYTEYFLITKK